MDLNKGIDAVAVFTSKGLQEILSTGGSGRWVLDPGRARLSTYLVCVQNRGEDGSPSALHGSAFLVGRINGVVEVSGTNEYPKRYLIKISEYATVDLPNAWQGWRNPVRYTTLPELGINLDLLKFQPVPEVGSNTMSSTQLADIKPLSISEAKRGLAVRFGVPESAIEITIRA